MSGQTIVKGKVCWDDGIGIDGVHIREKGKKNFTFTNSDGRYEITADLSSDLIFNIHGIDSVSEKINNRKEINVTFYKVGATEDVIARSDLNNQYETYSGIQKINLSDNINANEVNFAHSLEGRISGLEVRKNSSGIGGSTRLYLRGNKSFFHNSSPLFILDGIPITNVVGEQPGMWGGIDQGDGLSQINPDDIESITILKGINAASLYGSQGVNGVIDIKTKTGALEKMRININSGVSFEKVALIPEFQYRYGSDFGDKHSWSTTLGNYNNSFINDYFGIGTSFINTINISGGNSKTTTYFSYSNASQGGNSLNNRYRRNNLTYKQSTKFLNNRIEVSSLIMLVNEVASNKNKAGYYLNPLTGLYLFPRNGYENNDFSYFKNNYQYFRDDRNMYWQNWFIDDHLQSNPYWIQNKEPNEFKVKRVIGNLSTLWKISDDISVKLLGGYDFSERKKEVKHYAGSNPVNIHSNGGWEFQKYTDEQKYSEININYKRRFNNFFLKTLVGGRYQDRLYGDGIDVNTGLWGLVYPNEFYFQNLPTGVQVHSTIREKSMKKSMFTNTVLGFHDVLFLDFTLGKEWQRFNTTSIRSSFYYPMLGLTTVLNKLVKMPEWITYVKMGTSFAKGERLIPPYYGELKYLSEIDNTISNETNGNMIRPEKYKSIEANAEWGFFNSRLTGNITYYHTQSSNQLIVTNTAFGSPGTGTFYNTGQITNKGFEVELNAMPLKHKNGTWITSLNFSANDNTVVTIHPQVNWIDLGSSEGYSLRIKEGGSYGDLYVYKFRRDDDGKIFFDENGKPLRTNSKEYIGNVEPSWSLGWYNRIKYKNLELGFLIDSKFGGKVFSQTEAILDGYGVSARTADSRDLGYVEVDGIIESTGESITKVDAIKWYQTVGNRNGIGEQYVFSRTNIRLSKAVLAYELDMSRYELPLNSVKFSLVGTNLFYFLIDAPFDPELTMSSNRNSQSLDNFNFPATKTIGFNLKLTF